VNVIGPVFGVARKFAKDIPEYLTLLSQKKIDAYEMGFAYGIPEDITDDIIIMAKKFNIILSCHLPFFINLGNDHTEKNINYLVSGLKIAEKLNSISVFHLGFYQNKKYNDIKEKIVRDIKESLEVSGVKKGRLGIETTGKQKAIGTLDEIIDIVNDIDDNRVFPVIDWSHLFARNSGIFPKTYDDFKQILIKIEEEQEITFNYFHGGGIEHKNGNEVKHISAKVCKPPLSYLFSVLKDLGYDNFTFIVESPDSYEDVRWLKEVWDSPENYFEMTKNKEFKTLFDYV
jgi:endonuclease IV